MDEDCDASWSMKRAKFVERRERPRGGIALLIREFGS